jgi:acyl carrier protein
LSVLDNLAEHDTMTDALSVGDGVTRARVVAEICRYLKTYQVGEKPITGATVITKDLTIDSLAVMDMVMELEDQFDVSIPLSVVAEIYTVDQLADTVLALRAGN